MTPTKKYRLLKDLPNVKAGEILEWNSTETWSNGPYKGGRYIVHPMPNEKSCNIVFTTDDVENNPDWFELIVEPEQVRTPYGLLQDCLVYFDKDTTTVPASLYKSVFNFLFPPQSPQPSKEWEIVELDNSGVTKDSLRTGDTGRFDTEAMIKRGYKIKSVKRLSDNETFSIGDEVIHKTDPKELANTAKILKFIVPETTPNLMWFEFENGIDWCKDLKNFDKLPPTPIDKPVLFTTEDGVGIREDDVVWLVYTMSGSLWKPSMTKARKELLPVQIYQKWFSTVEKANDFVTMNKPCLSVKDILALWSVGGAPRKALIELAKSKHNTI